MESFLQICEDTTNSLGRQLEAKEEQFLQWVYDRYAAEQKEIINN
ncbi:Kv channel-interacting protein [Oceanobacillus picturae]|jgi:hypothetical protein|uniref:Kv channel-interacting protein n=1 Tax=Oceanobacillus picturae TaxID=171693 RepID=W9AHD3_9BACI|nr:MULTISPECIES: hypothetical protein [Oceanobacillus]GAQ17161.1 Kv channel-interacting protein [Oceanobacillus picturae]CDO05109.1 hypothetical protein BN988_03692 [Oceanobacillus picturae]